MHRCVLAWLLLSFELLASRRKENCKNDACRFRYLPSNAVCSYKTPIYISSRTSVQNNYVTIKYNLSQHH